MQHPLFCEGVCYCNFLATRTQFQYLSIAGRRLVYIYILFYRYCVFYMFRIYILDGKNHMLPTGELLIYNITKIDSQKVYRCRTHHKLTQDSVVSSNAGKIQLTGEMDFMLTV